MRRRELILLLGGTMTAARTLRAQQKTMPLIGFLSGTSPGPFAPYVAGFHQGLSETGYVEGQNVAIEYRWAEDRYDRLPGLAADLVGRKVDVIATSGGIPAARAAQNATSAYRSSLWGSATRSGPAWSPASADRVATSPA